MRQRVATINTGRCLEMTALPLNFASSVAIVKGGKQRREGSGEEPYLWAALSLREIEHLAELRDTAERHRSWSLKNASIPTLDPCRDPPRQNFGCGKLTATAIIHGVNPYFCYRTVAPSQPPPKTLPQRCAGETTEPLTAGGKLIAPWLHIGPRPTAEFCLHPSRKRQKWWRLWHVFRIFTLVARRQWLWGRRSERNLRGNRKQDINLNHKKVFWASICAWLSHD